MQQVDIQTWARKEAFEANSKLSNPFYSVTFELDVTRLYHAAHEKKLSFYHALTYLVTQAMNRIEAFRMVIRDGKVYRIEKREPSITELRKGEEQYYCVYIPFEGDMETFCQEAAVRRDRQHSFLELEHETDSLIYISCLPWLDFTALRNPMNMDTEDSIPRVVWGKYVQKDGRYLLHMSVEVNHRLLDGLHIGLFYQEICALLEAVE